MKEVDEQEFFVETDTGMRLMVKAKKPKTARSGRAVLLVHGSGVGWVYWDVPFGDYSIMNYLAGRGLDTYAVECRGYGESTKPNGMDVTATSTASDLKFVVSAIQQKSNVDKTSVVGHSSGGTVLLMASGMFPDLLDRMVLIGTPYKKINPQFIEYARMVINMSKEPGKDYVPNLHHKDIENRLDTHDEDVLAWYKKVVDEQYGLMPGGIFPDVIDNPGITAVPSVKAPTLILNGSNEYVIDPDDAVALFRDLGTPDKAIMIIPNGFHLPFIEKFGHVRLQESIFFWVTKE